MRKIEGFGSIPPYIVLLTLLGLLSMLAAAFYFYSKPEPVRVGTIGEKPASDSGDPEPTLSIEQADDVTVLMRRLQNVPNDADALMEIGKIFLEAEDWGRAAVFLNRAVLSRPAAPEPRYLLGIALYQDGKAEEAAKSFEELLELERYFAALYNLGIIYKYHMNKPDEAKALFEEIVAAPDADAETVIRAKQELEPE